VQPAEIEIGHRVMQGPQLVRTELPRGAHVPDDRLDAQ
jgi:hypothetical protein